MDERVIDSIGLEAPAVKPRRFALSPINQRRWANFKANKRGYYSFILFSVLFVLSLFAEFIANDRPYVVRVDGQSYYPVLFDYPEVAFGGERKTSTDYRDPYFKKLIADKGGWMVWPPIPYSYDTINYNPAGQGAAPPNADNLLGTDDHMRDVAARVIYGFRLSVLFGLSLTLFSSVIGVVAGAVQGYFGGWTDLLFQRFIEVWTSIPSLYLLMFVSSVIEPSFFILLGILLMFSWVALVHVVRAEFLRARNFEYIRAARALGVSNIAIMFKHMLPNAMVATLTFMPFILNHSITTLTALDFLGYGLPVGSPSFGELLQQGKTHLWAWWLGLTAFFVVGLMLSLLIFVGEAVRDAFDPRKTYV